MKDCNFSMEKDDEFLFGFFTHLSHLCFDKAKEHVEKERETNRVFQQGCWNALLSQLIQLALAEKSYVEIGFLQSKNKGFLRKDNSLRSTYEQIKTDVKRIEDNSKSNTDRRVANYCQNISQFLTARINLIDFYEKVYLIGLSKQLKYIELLNFIENLIQQHALGFTDISLTPIKAVFSMECEILEQLFKALTELQRLQFLASLALIHGAHTRLTAWETKLQNRETWKLGFLKTNPLPALFQWLMRLKATILSKFSLYFYNNLAQQTTPNDMRQLCAKLQHDHYHKVASFQKKHDAVGILFLANNKITCDTVTDRDNFPIIVTCAGKTLPSIELVQKLLDDASNDLNVMDKILFKHNIQDQYTVILTAIEASIHLVIIFDSQKTEKDAFIISFVTDLCMNLRCTKVFASLKNSLK